MQFVLTFGAGGGAVEITNCVKLCTWKSKLGVVRVPVMNCKRKLIVQKFQMCIRFCISVVLLFYVLNILGESIFQLKKAQPFLTSLSCGPTLLSREIQGDFPPSFPPYN